MKMTHTDRKAIDVLTDASEELIRRGVDEKTRRDILWANEHLTARLAADEKKCDGEPVAWLVECGDYRQPFMTKGVADAQVDYLRKGGHEVSITPLGNPYLSPQPSIPGQEELE